MSYVVSSGEVSSGIILNNDYMKVLNGGIASDTIVNSSGFMCISSGGIASDTTINYWGHLYVSSGGMANDTTVNSGGYLWITSGGTASNAKVNSRGYLHVSSGGTIDAATVNSGGSMYVSSGGTATNINWTPCVGSVWCDESSYVTFASRFSGIYYGSRDQLISHADTLTGQTVSGEKCSMYVTSGGTANATTVCFGGRIFVKSGGTANATTVCTGGDLYVDNGGLAKSTTITGGRLMDIWSGGTATDTTVNFGGGLEVYSGGTALAIRENGGYVYISSDANVTFIRNIFSNLILNYGNTTLHSGTTANFVTINGGKIDVFWGGITNFTTINDYGSLCVSSGGTANSTIVNSWGILNISNGGAASNTIVKSAGRMYVSSGGSYSGSLQIEGWAYVSAYSGATIDFTVAEQSDSGTALINDWSRISGGDDANYTLTVKADQAAGDYVLAEGAANFNKTITVKTTDNTALGTLAVGKTLKSGVTSYKLAEKEGQLALSVQKNFIKLTITALSAEKTYDGEALTAGYSYTGKLAEGDKLFVTVKGSQTDVGSSANAIADYQIKHGGVDVTGIYSVTTIDGTLSVTRAAAPQLRSVDTSGGTTTLHWSPSSQNEAADVALSKPDSADEKLEVRTAAQSLDLYSTPEKLDLSLKNTDSSNWSSSTELAQTSTGNATAIVANADGTADLFFANFKGIWDEDFVAGHVGSRDDWEGTGEEVSLAGKNRSVDTFTGSADANVLVMTDSANGDALFVDDVFSAFPAAQQSRLANIHTVLAGAGDDIVDLTSQQFEYTGLGLTVRGGDGSDTIWANKGNNLLFGDAGDDRLVGASGNDVLSGGSGNDSLHGGGGSDTFTFCNDWGEDAVEQLADGSVTLWFADGDTSNWNASTLTYADGDNRVTVSGVTADQISLKFGNDGSAQYGELAAAGAFLEATSGKIFTAKQSGIIVSL